MDCNYIIRFIKDSDCQEALDVYAHFAKSTTITFDYEAPAMEEFRNKIEQITSKHPWLVCLYRGKVIGYAYAGTHRHKVAYQWSAESTVYLSPDFHRCGIATILYESLLAILKFQGYVNVYAGITLPNEKSEGLHKAFGFNEIGIFKQIGFKMGKWHDVKWLQLHFSTINEPPEKLKPIKDIENHPEVRRILREANTKITAKLG